MTEKPAAPLDYQAAGVNIDAGNALVERIKGVAQSTRRPEVLAGLGGFGAFCELPKGYQQPVLVSGTDGVGTKLKLAMQLQRHDSIGIDLVAMCVNDLLVCGAEPLFFLDYYATGQLHVDTAAAVVEGIGSGCQQAGCALVGGETAEMPGMYQGSDYDLAGFCVGVVEKQQIIDGKNVQAGDQIIALGASGPHSNGYSLIRKILEVSGADLADQLEDQSLADWLMTPTRIYVKPVLSLLKEVNIKAIAHITGGGLLENLPRVLPEGVSAQINPWSWPAIFTWLAEQGQVAEQEMYRTFNCGIGMVLVVAPEQAEDCVNKLNALGEKAWRLGEIHNRVAQACQVSIG